ncbi:MAG: ABC transporter ATP-binding protein, partial [Firmicutes bacterium]|nr:ABC transporter ATP-binding protein [Bacillota bacterium]
MLRLAELTSGYGSVPIVRDLNLRIEDGEITVILGRNGVGKTTLMKTIIGILPAHKGSISFKGKDVTNVRASSRARFGMGYVPQGRGIFPRLTVEENLLMGDLINADSGRERLYDRVYSMFPRLDERRSQRGGTLSGGEQQMLAIGRALVGNPDLLILDEPSEGVQPSIVQDSVPLLKGLNQELGLTMLVVEQNLDFAMSLAERCYVMDRGTIVAELDKSEMADPE